MYVNKKELDAIQEAVFFMEKNYHDDKIVGRLRSVWKKGTNRRVSRAKDEKKRNEKQKQKHKA